MYDYLFYRKNCDKWMSAGHLKFWVMKYSHGENSLTLHAITMGINVLQYDLNAEFRGEKGCRSR